MANRFTVYFTYMLKDDVTIKTGVNTAYSTPAHCNYINKFETDTLVNAEVNIFFDNINDFQFLSTNDGGTGFTANKIYMLIQVVENQPIDDSNDNLEVIYSELQPESDSWRIFDVTNQILDHVSGDTLTASGLTTTVFKVPILNYDLANLYDINYLNYPDINNTELLCFGDEEIFLGNVETEVEASVYTTDLGINLALNEFNSSTNPTWDGESEVYVSEIGIYNDNRELIAIGKLNNPLKKNNVISRTIVFAIDF